MTDLDKEIEAVERTLRRWFPGRAFVRAAGIGDHEILPEERALVAAAVHRRQCEFATGRWLARQGLRQFGLPDEPIRVGKLRNPVWPEAVRGTISHDGELCAVVLTRGEGEAASIGIDLVALPQRAGRMEELAPMFVASAGELSAMAAFGLAVDPELLLFSLKESVIKALSFRLNDFIDMRAIEIRGVGRSTCAVSGETIPADMLAAIAGNYLVTAARVN